MRKWSSSLHNDIQDKQALREKLFATRQKVTAEERRAAAESALALLFNTPLFLESQHIACYFAADNEFECLPFIKAIWDAKKNCFLPVLSHESCQGLTFAAYHPDDRLCLNRYNILEPEHKEIFPVEELDLVLMPLVGFDLQGNRLGMGGGYYDRTFANVKNKPYLMGLAYECQYVPEIPEESFDVPLDAVLTENKLYTFRRVD